MQRDQADQCHGLLALRVHAEYRALVVGIAEAMLAGSAMMLAPVEVPEACLLLANAVEDELVDQPLAGVGVQEAQGDADHGYYLSSLARRRAWFDVVLLTREPARR